MGTLQLRFDWDRLPGSESPGATVRQATAATEGANLAETLVMEEAVRKENLEKALKRVGPCQTSSSPNEDS